ncbi:hypothetical protein COLO4_22335 [Corchorus olitorius]|uniref:Uncharacterized protein n=1 Tax=Corchorus olitorius TaxID=93759 RepID=A0A1R3IMX5_9ROSI|nr:hypothetical protein COLO4_22335 [Corchorus olitorius]
MGGNDSSTPVGSSQSAMGIGDSSTPIASPVESPIQDEFQSPASMGGLVSERETNVATKSVDSSSSQFVAPKKIDGVDYGFLDDNDTYVIAPTRKMHVAQFMEILKVMKSWKRWRLQYFLFISEMFNPNRHPIFFPGFAPPSDRQSPPHRSSTRARMAGKLSMSAFLHLPSPNLALDFSNSARED